MAHAISVTSTEHGPATIPIHSIRLVKRNPKGEAIILFSDGKEVTVEEAYKTVSSLLTSSGVHGIISVERLN
ncbi:hypothetical protein N8590_02965 [bacterium]|nr:hypothetical protein [bacterium]